VEQTAEIDGDKHAKKEWSEIDEDN